MFKWSVQFPAILKIRSGIVRSSYVEIAEQVLTSVKNSKNAFLTPEISVCQVTALSQSGFVDITVGITIGITNGITNDQSRNLRYER